MDYSIAYKLIKKWLETDLGITVEILNETAQDKEKPNDKDVLKVVSLVARKNTVIQLLNFINSLEKDPDKLEEKYNKFMEEVSKNEK